ncbi:glycosyltransferase [bacterium]|nr:glycosyltransferase [bacterium]
MSRIVITTWGSLGDLHPYVAIALGLHDRGHEVTVATCPSYRQKIESMGLNFRPVRPDCDWLQDAEKVRWFSHPRFGLLRVGQKILMPNLRDAFEDTLNAAKEADLLVTMMACYATRLVAEKERIPWVSAVHIPLGFFSGHDPPILEFSPFLSRQLRYLGPVFWRPFLELGKRVSRPLAEEWYRLRAEIGLPRTTEGNPLADSHSPTLVLALFSPLLASKQPDWPSQTVVTGQPLYDNDGESELEPSLSQFLNNGPPPIVFTLGSAVCANAGAFYEHSITCARSLQQRAVFVVGKGQLQRIPPLPADMSGVEYAPFSELFPRAAAIVHHGGIGTTGLAMRSGRPMLVVPFAWDQPDNAERVKRLGIARSIPKHHYTARTAARELAKLLDDQAYAERASIVAERVGQEHGVSAACDALEDLLARRGKTA